MELKEILSVSGVPGLFKYVAQGKGGIIVESLVDKKRTMVGGTAKVSALGDIAVFTQTAEIPLADIFQTIFDKNEGKQIEPLGKASPDELKTFMGSILPDYDTDRVHNSDIKKISQWYNILVGAGMTSFKIEEEVEATEEEAAKDGKEEKKPAAKKSTAAKPKTNTVKQAAPKAASRSKAPSSRSTTARKAQ